MVGLKGKKMNGKAGSENPIGHPHKKGSIRECQPKGRRGNVVRFCQSIPLGNNEERYLKL